MENKTRFGLLGAGAVVAVAAAFVVPSMYADRAAENAASVPSVSVSALPSDAALDGRPLLTGSWSVAEGSEAGYRVNEVLNGQDVVVTGRTPQVSGGFTIDEQGTSLTRAEFTVNVASIATDSQRRDDYFKKTTVDTEVHPTAVLTVSEPVTFEAPAAGQTVSLEVKGELTLAGVTKPVTFTAELAGNSEQIQVAATVPLTFADFGIEAPNLGFVSVEESGSIEVQLVATPAV